MRGHYLNSKFWMKNKYSSVLITHVKSPNKWFLENLIYKIKICYGPCADAQVRNAIKMLTVSRNHYRLLTCSIHEDLLSLYYSISNPCWLLLGRYMSKPVHGSKVTSSCSVDWVKKINFVLTCYHLVLLGGDSQRTTLYLSMYVYYRGWNWCWCWVYRILVILQVAMLQYGGGAVVWGWKWARWCGFYSGIAGS